MGYVVKTEISNRRKGIYLPHKFIDPGLRALLHNPFFRKGRQCYNGRSVPQVSDETSALEPVNFWHLP